MERAIDDYAIAGVETTLPFCRFVMGHPAFRSGLYDTLFVRDHFRPELLNATDLDDMAAAALVAAWIQEAEQRVPALGTEEAHRPSPWWMSRR